MVNVMAARCFLFLFFLVATPDLFAQDPPSPADTGSLADAIHSAAAQAELKGRWVVRSVSIDGKPGSAQVGQEIGDVITMGLEGDRFSFG